MNSSLPDHSWTRIAWWGVLLLAIYRLAVLAYGDIPIDVEEAYYLSWSQQLAAGYFSKPPLLAWMLAGVSHTLGESPLAIKSLAVLLYTATALVVYALGARLYCARTGAWAALAFQSLPIVGVLSLFISTDAPLMLFWALTLYGFVRAVEHDDPRWWIFVGVVAGLGLLSKYTIGALALGLLLAVLVEPRWRQLLSSRGLWLGVAVALLVWSPNLAWLAAHDFVTLRHTEQITVGIARAGEWGNLFEFLLGQVGVFGPIMTLAMLFLIARRPVWSDSANRLLLLSSLPLLLLVCVQAWRTEANLNWASPAYIGLTLLVTHLLLQRWRAWLIGAIAFNLVLLSGMYHYHALAERFDIQLTRKTDPYFKRLGWAELGQQLVALRRLYPDAPLLSDSRKLLALFGYHARLDGRMAVLRAWNPGASWRHQYDLYGDIQQDPTGDFLLLSREPVSQEVLASFAAAELMAVLKVRIYVDLSHQVYVYHVRDFRGYR